MNALMRWIESATRCKRILVVDDEQSQIDLMQALMDDHHCVLVPALTGRQAIEILEDEQQVIDFVLLDLKLTDMDGIDIFRAIKTHPISTMRPHLPVSVVSGHIDNITCENLRRYGFCCIVSKNDLNSALFIRDMLKTFGVMPKMDFDQSTP